MKQFPYLPPPGYTGYSMEKTAPFRELVEKVRHKLSNQWTSDLYYYVNDKLIRDADLEKTIKEYYVDYQNNVYMLHVVYSTVNIER